MKELLLVVAALLLTSCTQYRCIQYGTIISVDHCDLFENKSCVVTTNDGQKHTIRNLDDVEVGVQICIIEEQIK